MVLESPGNFCSGSVGSGTVIRRLPSGQKVFCASVTSFCRDRWRKGEVTDFGCRADASGPDGALGARAGCQAAGAEARPSPPCGARTRPGAQTPPSFAGSLALPPPPCTRDGAGPRRGAPSCQDRTRDAIQKRAGVEPRALGTPPEAERRVGRRSEWRGPEDELPASKEVLGIEPRTWYRHSTTDLHLLPPDVSRVPGRIPVLNSTSVMSHCRIKYNDI
ncbi:uncharacterized protein [Dasypus novemcinctus]|uniref:uncharacterized protein n=1 Tax=Dasypus novemcinctus TaxID=9361 RepID=UPI00265E5105|nr:uncharacterized protein LOC111760616 [Dasypus novemcinctus]